MNVLSVVVSSAAIEIQGPAVARFALSNIFKVGTELKTYFRGKKFMALRSVMPRSDMGVLLYFCIV